MRNKWDRTAQICKDQPLHAVIAGALVMSLTVRLVDMATYAWGVNKKKSRSIGFQVPKRKEGSL